MNRRSAGELLSRTAAFGIALAGLTLVSARASSVGFTYDEAFSYFHYLGAPLSVVLTFAGSADANNHTLNSLLMGAASRVFGDSELSLRLPNVLAYVGFAISVLVIAGRLRHRLAGLTLTVLLLLNPFLIELFSLARGYGLALALSTASLALMTALPDDAGGEPTRMAWAALLAGLAVLANLTFLDFFVTLLLVMAWWALRRRRDTHERARELRPLIVTVLIGCCVALYALVALGRLRARQQLYYGGHDGFWGDTAGSLIRCILYLRSYTAAATPVLWVLVLLGVASSAWSAWRDLRVSPRGEPGVLVRVVAVLLGGCLLGVIAHALVGTPYRINRTAAWMLPVFLVLAALLLDRGLSSRSAAVRRAAASLCVALAIAGAAHLAACANTRYAILQLHDGDTKEAILDLAGLRGTRATGGVVTFASWELRPSLEYYRATHGLAWLAFTDSAAAARAAFAAPREAGSLAGMRIRKRYLLTGNLLAVRDAAGSGRSATERDPR